MSALTVKETEGFTLPSPGPDEHFGEIVKEYPNQWVAIVDKKVVAAGRTIAEVEKAATEKTGRDDFPIYLAEKGLRVYNR
jgi:hypothetical protein